MIYTIYQIKFKKEFNYAVIIKSMNNIKLK